MCLTLNVGLQMCKSPLLMFHQIFLAQLTSLPSPQDSRISLSRLGTWRIVPGSHIPKKVEPSPAPDEITDTEHICSFSSPDWIHRLRVMLQWGEAVRRLELTCEGLSARCRGER